MMNEKIKRKEKWMNERNNNWKIKIMKEKLMTKWRGENNEWKIKIKWMKRR